MSISSTIKSIQDIMRKDVGVDGDAQRIGQLVWMFFLKIYDDKETEYELLDDNYRSPIPDSLRWRNWAADQEGMTGDELLDFVNNQLFPTLKDLQPKGSDKRGYVIRGVFEDAYNYMKSGHLMRQVINKIVGGIDFNKAQDRHLFGDLYEQILRDLQNAGNAGEYYTPRPVTQFMVDMVAPQLGEKILDPACGTGGFLTCAIETVRRHQVKTVDDEQRLQDSIHGVEKKPLPHLLCTTNMILHGIDVPTNVRHDNTLSRPLRDYGPRDRVDVIVTNPPFGGMEEDGIENNFPATFRTRETADLFLVLIMHLLKDGGRAAVVLPDGTLFGEGIKTRIKEQLLETCNLHTIVRLPNGVFAPYTGIKTNLLFFTKGSPTTDVWFYEHPYPAGVKNYNKTKPMRLEEFAAEKAWWTDRVENEYAWKVGADEIKARNYNLDVKNPHSPDLIVHDPEVLLADYAQLQERIAQTRNQLKAVLAAALEGRHGVGVVLSEHLPLLASAPDGIKKLRGLILELAVRGKLVPQDPEDEPASELLKRIASKKSGQKSKLMASLDSDERPFEVPDSWQWTRFESVFSLEYGDNLPAPKRTNSGEFPVYGSNGVVGSHSECSVRNSCIVVGRKGSAGALNLCQSAGCWVTDVAYYCIPPKEFDLLFCFKMFHTLGLAELGKGIKPGLSRSEAYVVPVAIPPLAEQRRIVAKVDELMALCDRLESDLVESLSRQARLTDTLIAAALEAA